MRQISTLSATIGRRRFRILVAALILAVALALGWQKYFLPHHEAIKGQKLNLESEKARLQTEIQQLPEKYRLLKASEARFDALQAKGLLDQQDRILARTRMDNLRNDSGLRGIDYNIEPQVKVDHPNGYLLDKDIVRSPIQIAFKGLTDIEMRNFFEKMRTDFGGLVVAKSIELKRGEPLNESNLRRLGNKEPVDFVSGQATFDWYSFTVKPADPNAPEAQAFGGVAQ